MRPAASSQALTRISACSCDCEAQHPGSQTTLCGPNSALLNADSALSTFASKTVSWPDCQARRSDSDTFDLSIWPVQDQYILANRRCSSSIRLLRQTTMCSRVCNWSPKSAHEANRRRVSGSRHESTSSSWPQRGATRCRVLFRPYGPPSKVMSMKG